MQLTTLAKKSYKGFTLIELLVVIAIIGLLSTIVAAPVQSARKKAKDTKKIAEMKQMQTALSNYANDNGQFPNGSSSPSLTVLTPSYIPTLPTSITTATINARDKTYYTSYNAYPVGSTVRKNFGYHMGVTLEVYNAVLSDDADCWGVVGTSSPNISGNKDGGPCLSYMGATIGATNTAAVIGSSTRPVVGTYTGTIANIPNITATGAGVATYVVEQYNWVAHPASPDFNSDFQGLGVNEGSTSTCSTIDLCIYDVADAY